MNSILLREAYSLLAATPATHVRLDTYKHVDGQGNVSGCLLGHLALVHFSGLSLDADGCLIVPDQQQGETGWLWIAKLFDIELTELLDLAGVRREEENDPALSDKEVLMERFAILYSRHGFELHPRSYYLHLEKA